MMNQKEIFRKIGTIVSELNEQYQYLSSNPDSLNDLELELFSANSDFLAEHVKVLKKLSVTSVSKEAAVESVVLPEVKKEEEPEVESEPMHVPVVPQPILSEVGTNEARSEETIQSSENISLAEKIQRRMDEIASSRTAVLAEEPAEEKPGNIEVKSGALVPPAEPKTVEEPSPVIREVVIPEKTTFIDPVAETDEPGHSTSVPTINDIISAQRNQPATVISPLVNTQPVTDLKSIISLNDKLLFIKDLFNGYSLAYSEAIELVNRFDSFEAADNFLKTNYAAKNNWVSKQATVDKFYELLNRRFSK